MQPRIKKIVISAFIGLFFFFLPEYSQGVIYKIIESDGSIHITDTPSGKGTYNAANTAYKSVSSKNVSPALINNYSEMIDEAARKYKHDPKLIKSIIKHESNFDPSAISNKGAVGLMQLMPDTASRFGVADTFDPKQNIEGGAAYLNYLMEQFDGDLPLVLAAYNAGEGAVQKYMGIPPYNETEKFVGKVLGAYNGKEDISASSNFKSRKSRIHIIKQKDGTILITNR